MNKEKYAITFACYNQVQYTKMCIESMVKHGLDLSRLVVVDNASSDSTCEYLKTLSLGGLILNQSNLGCGVAWNQGALFLQSEWTIVMNNDVIVSAGWIENLIETAEKNNLKVISPSMIEGELDYDFDDFATKAGIQLRESLRLGTRHAVCLAIHQSVWQEVGYFQPIPKLLGYEDTIFFHALAEAGVATAITGASWLHHYGSVTQTAMKLERGLAKKDNLGSRYNYRLLKQSWLKRKLNKLKRNKQIKAWRNDELSQFGITMHGIRKNNTFNWR